MTSRPGAPTRAHQAARRVALVITVASGLAVLPLIVALLSTTSFLARGADAAYGELITGWLLAALAAAAWNIFFGLRAVAAPSWRRITRLAAPTLILLLIAIVFIWAA
jgi:hypothetical protein